MKRQASGSARSEFSRVHRGVRGAVVELVGGGAGGGGGGLSGVGEVCGAEGAINNGDNAFLIVNLRA